jgi:hypothetical protein
MVKSLYSNKPQPWLTSGIRTSCANERKLYLVYRNNNDPSIKEHFKKYCRILDKVIRTAKKYFLLKSNNKTRTTWNIVKTITNNKRPTENITTMNLKKKLFGNSLAMVNAFNEYFSSVAEKLFIKKLLGESHC